MRCLFCTMSDIDLIDRQFRFAPSLGQLRAWGILCICCVVHDWRCVAAGLTYTAFVPSAASLGAEVLRTMYIEIASMYHIENLPLFAAPIIMSVRRYTRSTCHIRGSSRGVGQSR
jgi:hypothetical protein